MRAKQFWIPLLALIAACASPAPAPSTSVASAPADESSLFRTVASVDEVMDSILDPAADVIWGSVGTIITIEKTEELEPKTDEDWMHVRNAAITVAEAGNLLMMQGRVPNDADWIKMSQALIEVGSRAVKAADAKDKAALFDAGGEIYSVCTACHSKFMIGSSSGGSR